MAYTTAASFMLLGTSVSVLTWKRVVLSQGFAILALLVATIALLGTVYQVSTRHYWSPYRPMAIATAFSLGLLSLSILFLEAKSGLMASVTNKTAGGTMARRLLLVALLAPLLIGWITLWGQQQEYYGPGFGVVLSTALCMVALTAMIWWNATMLYRSEVGRLQADADIQRLLQEAQDREKELREKQRQLVQAAKLASIGELATGVAHELNNPLNNIALIVGNELDKMRLGVVEGERIERELNLVQEQVNRAASIVNQLRTFGRGARHERGPLALKEVLGSALNLVRRQMELHNISIVMNLGGGTPYVLGDRLQLEQVFLNLLTNARDAVATVNQKEIVLSIRVGPEFVEISVRDSGTGMTADVQERVFDPFFTTKAVGKGTGLGLSITHGIIQSHGGMISVESAPGRGTVFTVKLPIMTVNNDTALFLHGHETFPHKVSARKGSSPCLDH
jgi:C4-dicarboxylate-specific signal transduction histidine kinase